MLSWFHKIPHPHEHLLLPPPPPDLTALFLLTGLEGDEPGQQRPESAGIAAARDRRVPGELLEVLVEKLLAAGVYAPADTQLPHSCSWQ